MTEIPKSKFKDIMTAEEFQELKRTGVIITKGKRIKQQELIPEYDKMLHDTPLSDNELIIPIPLITLNQYIFIERGNKFNAAKKKKELTAKVAQYAKSLNIDFNGLYDLEITWTTPNNKTDADNTYFAQKFILDGIVAAGKLKDDTRKHIRHISHKIFTEKGITLTKVKLIPCTPSASTATK